MVPDDLCVSLQSELLLWVQMDAVNRSCIVSAHFGSHQVRLVVKFPAQYPNNAAPAFQFVSPTSIPTAMRTKIQKVLCVLVLLFL